MRQTLKTFKVEADTNPLEDFHYYREQSHKGPTVILGSQASRHPLPRKDDRESIT